MSSCSQQPSCEDIARHLALPLTLAILGAHTLFPNAQIICTSPYSAKLQSPHGWRVPQAPPRKQEGTISNYSEHVQGQTGLYLGLSVWYQSALRHPSVYSADRSAGYPKGTLCCTPVARFIGVQELLRYADQCTPVIFVQRGALSKALGQVWVGQPPAPEHNQI